MYIAIEGVIGVGKTTLARMLQPFFEADLQIEVFEENPFLANFYEDRVRYAFQTQIFFLLSRYNQQRRAVRDTVGNGHNLLTDYTFAKDGLFARINLSGDELEMYKRVHDALGEKVMTPDLVVYLRAGTDVLMQRIAQRDRHYERNMQREYIEMLNIAYDEFYGAGVGEAQVLTIECNDLDFVTNQSDLEHIDNLVRQALKMIPFQAELPLRSKAQD